MRTSAPATRPAGNTGRSRMRAVDLVGSGLLGLRARKLRAALSALGIAIGIAAGGAAAGISCSSKGSLLPHLGSEGCLLPGGPCHGYAGRPSPLAHVAEPVCGPTPH